MVSNNTKYHLGVISPWCLHCITVQDHVTVEAECPLTGKNNSAVGHASVIYLLTLEREKDHCLFPTTVVAVHTAVTGGHALAAIGSPFSARHPAQHAICIVIGSLATAVGFSQSGRSKSTTRVRQSRHSVCFRV